FVATYAQKASGHEPLPIVHWWRIEGLVVLLATAVALALHFTPGGWALSGGIGIAVAFAGTAAALWFRRRYAHPRVDPQAAADAPRIMRCMPEDRIPAMA